MNRLLLLLFVVLPFCEIWLMIWAGHWMGGWYLLLALLTGGMIGVHIIRHQGMRTLTAIRERVARHAMPGAELLDGALVLLSGLLFIVPGFLSDLAGLFLALPWGRFWVRCWMLAVLEEKIRSDSLRHEGMVIEGESLRQEKNE